MKHPKVNLIKSRRTLARNSDSNFVYYGTERNKNTQKNTPATGIRAEQEGKESTKIII
jgi:hypothetical protein